jgi:hypothetical protein
MLKTNPKIAVFLFLLTTGREGDRNNKFMRICSYKDLV